MSTPVLPRPAPAEEADHGAVFRVGGPVVVARGLRSARLYDVVRVGPARLPGEVIRLLDDETVIQVYEDTAGLRAGDPVEGTGEPLRVELGPGLLGAIVDGTARPLPALASTDAFIRRGADPPTLDRHRRWGFRPAVEAGPGELLGTVAETAALTHRVLVPPGMHGAVTDVRSGPLPVDEPVAHVGGHPVAMLTRWPVREPRPFARRLPLDVPLITGQRVLDTLFPVARGGAATIPGGFGTGKTVTEQSLAKWSHADVVVYVGCGERGNELTEVLEEFPRLVDPRTGASLLDRTVLVANTSNMPVAAREASIYTGITIAEYYRDQGYAVALLADSTSRWGEALREVSARLAEMPAEEGYPAYLATRLANFYERAGSVRTLGGRLGSVTVVGAVSPAGGDFSEPITQYSLRLAGTFWALDTALARQRHFPAVHWSRSYTLYDLDSWYAEQVAAGWGEQRAWALDLLARDTSLQEIVALLSADALAPPQRVILRTGRLLREDFLQQSSFDEVDAYCPLPKQYAMLRVIRAAHEAMAAAVARGVDVAAATTLLALAEVGRMKRWPPEQAADRAAALITRLAEDGAAS